MINECVIIVYMDDIFLFTPDEITLTNNIKRGLQRLQDTNLFLTVTKCEFNKTKVEYLGMVIEEGKISMDPGNWQASEIGQLLPQSKQFRSS